MVFTMSLGLFTPVYAANVALNLGVDSKVDIFDSTYPIENQSSAELALSTAADLYFQYVAAGNFAVGQTISIVATTPLVIASCVAPTTDADQDGTPDGTGAVSGDNYTYTFYAPTTQAAASITLCINVDNSIATAGNYSFIMADDLGDFGGAFLYIGTPGGAANDVYVTATVTSQELEFWIRNAADTADTNACALGTLNTTSVSTCNYALKVRTTATIGYTISWTSDGELDRSGTATIDAIAMNTAVAVGVEGYGVTFTPGANTDGGTCTAQNIWTAAYDDPVSTTAQSLVVCNKANLPAATGATTYIHNMDHQAAIDPATPAGSYDQIVTYYVTAQF